MARPTAARQPPVAAAGAARARRPALREPIDQRAAPALDDPHAFLTDVPAGLFRTVLEPSGELRIVYLNGAAGELLGVPPELAIANPNAVLDQVHEEDLKRELRMLREAEGDAPVHCEIRIRMPSGRTRWLRASIRRRRLPSGEIVADGAMLDITERKELEARVQESEQRLRAMTANLPGVVFRRSFDERGRPQFHFLSFSHELAAWLGLTPEEGMADGKRVLLTLHPEDRDPHLAAVREALAERRPLDREFRLRSPEGAVRWMRMISVTSVDEAGRLVADGITIDITRQKQIEEELRESEARLRAITDNLPGAVVRYVVEADGGAAFTYVSPSFERLFDISAQALMADASLLEARMPAEDRAPCKEQLAGAADSCAHHEHCFRLRGRDGRLRWVRAIARPRREADGGIVCDGLFLDISAQRQAELRLRDSEQLLTVISDNLPVAVFRYLHHPTEGGRVAFIGPAVESLVGVSVAEALADPDFLVRRVHPEDRDAYRQAWRQPFAGGEMAALEFRLATDEATPRWLRIVARTRLDADGTLVCDGALIDVTSQRQMAEDLDRLNRQLVTLCRISHIALHVDDLDRGLREIVDEITEVVPGATVIIALYDEDAHVVEIKASSSRSECQVRRLAEETLSWEVVRTRRPVLEHNIQARSERRLRTPQYFGDQTFFGLPIRVGEQVIGALAVTSREDLILDDLLVERLWSYADAIATYIASRSVIASLPARPGVAEDDLQGAFVFGLTERQRQVLALLDRGLTNRELAEALGLQEATVKVHLRAIYQALGARNRTEALSIARAMVRRAHAGTTSRRRS